MHCIGGAGIAKPSSHLNKIQIVIGEKVISINFKNTAHQLQPATTTGVLCFSNRPGKTPQTVYQT
jgi:hypothetical protein